MVNTVSRKMDTAVYFKEQSCLICGEKVAALYIIGPTERPAAL